MFVWQVNNKFLFDVPGDGGSLTEGIIGTPRFINPILAISDADRDLTALIYSSLMRPDNKRELILDLAEKYEVSQDNLSYTFTLKSGLEWPDRKPITSDDIIFTIKEVKDSDIKSPRRASWEGVEVEKIDDRIIKFTLKKPYAPFLENLTLGILPKHIWQEASSEQMIFSDFNTNPIGSGPYQVDKINRNSSGIATSYILVPNEKFVLEKPHLTEITIKFYQSEKELLAAYQKGEIQSINAISPSVAENIKNKNATIKTLSLPRIFAIFFNHNNAKVFAQAEAREALSLTTNKEEIIDSVLAGYGTKLDYPIPPGTFGALHQDAKNGTIDQIKEILKKGGWTFNETDNVWEKNIKPENKAKKTSAETIKLEFSIFTSEAGELKQVAEILKKQWEAIGAKVGIKIFEIGDLDQNIIRPRKYDALLFGQIIGRDPDPFAYWHSSQRNDPGLNFSMYTNITVDKLLEEARTTSDDKQRMQKYESFQKEISKDNPAVFLYSPRFIYVIPNSLEGMDKVEHITVPSERFSQVYKWYIKTEKVWKIFAK